MAAAGAAFRATHTGCAAQTSSSPNDPESNLPSIFDILSQESLTASLKPGLRHLLQFISLWHPRRFKVVNKFYDEFYALLTFVLENHYLKQYSASFAENFYGMKRVFISGSKTDCGFSTFCGRIKSLLCLVLLPYLSCKMENLMKSLGELLPHQRTKMASLVLRVYPYIRSACMILALAFQILYALRYMGPNYAPLSSSPLLYFAGVFLQRLTPNDIQQFKTLPLHLVESGITARLWRFVFKLLSFCGRLFSYGLFFFQFLEYFYSNDITKQFSALSETGQFQHLTAPPHPYKSIPSENYVLSSMGPGKCPLCYKTRDNDTVLSVSGYVFCYTCIFNFVRREARCPITSIPATINQLVKIYKT